MGGLIVLGAAVLAAPAPVRPERPGEKRLAELSVPPPAFPGRASPCRAFWIVKDYPDSVWADLAAGNQVHTLGVEWVVLRK